MLITTGKNPGRISRRIAQALQAAVPGAALEYRGRRSVASLLSKARKRHFSRLCAIHEENGKPSAISFLSLGQEGGWRRLSPTIMVHSAVPALAIPRKQSRSVKISGAKKAALQKLLDPSASGWETESSISASTKKIALFCGKKRVLLLGVGYGK